MQNNKTEIKEYKPDNTDVFSELIEVRTEILKTEMEIQQLAKENAEITRDSGLMKQELTINRLCYANNFSDFEQKIAIYLLDGQTGKEAITGKFEILKSLLDTRRHILDILGNLESEEKGEI
jgi:hypothetical protein